MLRTIGVRLRPVAHTLTETIEAISSASVDLAFSRWVADYPDADSFVHVLHTREGLLGQLCGSPDIDRLIETGRIESHPASRHSTYSYIERAIAREALALPLFHEQGYRFVRPEVEGLSMSVWNPSVAFERLVVRG